VLVHEGRVTAEAVLRGLASAVVGGFVMAIAMHLITPFRTAAYPLVIASQAMPVITLAPLLIIAFGFGIGPKLAMVAIIGFFPITISLLAGFGSVDADLAKLM